MVYTSIYRCFRICSDWTQFHSGVFRKTLVASVSMKMKLKSLFQTWMKKTNVTERWQIYQLLTGDVPAE